VSIVYSAGIMKLTAHPPLDSVWLTGVVMAIFSDRFSCDTGDVIEISSLESLSPLMYLNNGLKARLPASSIAMMLSPLKAINRTTPVMTMVFVKFIREFSNIA
jgi:hypothetical protein